MQTAEQPRNVGGRPKLPRGVDGKPVRAVERTASQQLIDRKMKGLTQVAITKALEGDGHLLRVLIDRGIPALRPVDQQGVLLPGLAECSTIEESVKLVRRGVADGRIAPAQAKEVLAYLKFEVELVDLGDALERIAELYASQGKSVPPDISAALAAKK